MQKEGIEERYVRQAQVRQFGAEGQRKLAESKILVVGAGGLGCPALQYLAAGGVGTLGVLDCDRVEATNLHRQLLYAQSDVGTLKAVAVANRLKILNPSANVVPYPVHLDRSNALEILSKYDLVLECSDNFPTKFLVNDACVILGKPFIVGGAIEFSGQLSVYNYNGGPTLRCLITHEPDLLDVPTCGEVGVVGMVPGVIGTLQALEALKVVAGIPSTLSGRLLQFDGLTMQFAEFEIVPNPKNFEIKQLAEYNYVCLNHAPQHNQVWAHQLIDLLNGVEPLELLQFGENIQPFQYKGYQARLVSLSELQNAVPTLSRTNKLILLCDYGAKSLAAFRYLTQKQGFTNVLNLKDGLKSLVPLLKE